MSSDKHSDTRPDPEALLEKIHKAARGKLTLFLGAAAGVGKTFTMLEAAQERLREGTDVVIGWIETHGRAETESLVAGLPGVTPRSLEYRGKVLREMDLDAILERKPELVLVDELAHTNVPGSRHVRRFQDVEELLKAGINVYTTLNIQHIESLNDVVAQITGIVVRETVPDYIVEEADSVQLIDIPPEELIKRLKEGKVYVPGQAEKALRNFFRPGNINALRELALRFTATRVDQDLSQYMKEHRIGGPWPAAGRIMVCVSASPFSAQLIRAARRLAGGLRAEWLAVHIETARRFPMGDTERDRVARNLRLAEELGARTLSVSAADMVDEILEIACSHNVTLIVIGKPRHSRLRELIHGSVVEKLIKRSGPINIYVIQASQERFPSKGISTAPSRPAKKWRPYAGGLAMTAAVTVLGWQTKNVLEIVNIALLYQLPVTLSAFWWGRWPSYFTALAGVLAFDCLFVPPVFTFSVNDIRYLWSFLTFLVVAFVIGGRTELLRHEASLARQREKSTRALYEFSRDIAAVVDLATITGQLALRVSETLGRRVVILLPDEGNKLIARAQHCPDAEDSGGEGMNDAALADSSEAAVAAWVYEHREVAGRSTETLPGAEFLYIPLQTRDNVVGVLGIHIMERFITPEQRRLMEAWAGLAAIAVERVKLTEGARQAAVFVESEKLRTALLNSISHELRTPLASILGSISTLLEAEAVYSAEERRELLENIKDGATRMDRVVANLLDTARLESGLLRLKIDWCDMEDIIGTALRRLEVELNSRRIVVHSPPEIALVRGDCVLLEQVVVNLVDNALKYSPADRCVEISVTQDHGRLQVAVADRGVGIPEAELPFIFDKFYRGHSEKSQVSGTGLGLSICKGIIEAHGGEIKAGNRPGGGAEIVFALPV
ncbi:MAG TPA: sensor histidine kinase KdpD [Selenomonadales bacterium]|nr:sensor histidine kinase KdpD [Selenomonadales bacterium]